MSCNVKYIFVFNYFNNIRFIVYKVLKLINVRKYFVLMIGIEFFYMDIILLKFNYKIIDIMSII